MVHAVVATHNSTMGLHDNKQPDPSNDLSLQTQVKYPSLLISQSSIIPGGVNTSTTMHSIRHSSSIKA
ncbi:predicted protein [Lichtheimia corymbifera JMRC:FSU:9682]|uniref:Uncharacterized protein n=1 Tax=Lichtheimia corymbifera JMRC:FSU:9682 TaxID=1263082 RepID=A0A068SFS0_9FUNG|nr:predicted protein [Lichtheimia corymbifera JMRC:FSU:9682]